MTDVNKLLPFILKWEGGYVNHPDDKGGATNMGITLATWQQVGYDKNGDGVVDCHDLRMVTVEDAAKILKQYYWDRWKADRIKSQSVANILVDWVYCSGKWGIVIPQRLLGVDDDGIVGSKTLSALNNFDPATFFDIIQKRREKYLRSIVERQPKQRVFLKGWLNRLYDLTFDDK